MESLSFLIVSVYFSELSTLKVRKQGDLYGLNSSEAEPEELANENKLFFLYHFHNFDFYAKN